MVTTFKYILAHGNNHKQKKKDRRQSARSADQCFGGNVWSPTDASHTSGVVGSNRGNADRTGLREEKINIARLCGRVQNL
jgi:hypothetical protein